MTRLLEYGFQRLAIDYSGYGFSTGHVNRRKTLQDGNTALETILSMPEVDGTKVIIYGQSLGGHLAAVVAKMNEEEIDGLVTEGAFSSHKDIAKVFAGSFGKAFVKEFYSAKDSIALFHKPVLIIHSTEDEIIPYLHERKAF
jgi:pimeloyl-ACP methyl ester carboxylesterase